VPGWDELLELRFVDHGTSRVPRQVRPLLRLAFEFVVGFVDCSELTIGIFTVAGSLLNQGYEAQHRTLSDREAIWGISGAETLQ
jgi:hypothetical protein